MTQLNITLEPSEQQPEAKLCKAMGRWTVSLANLVKTFGLQDFVGKKYLIQKENDMFVIDLTNSME